MKLSEETMGSWLQRLVIMETDLENLFTAHADSLPDESKYKRHVLEYLKTASERRKRLQNMLQKVDEKDATFRKSLANLLGSLKGTLDGMRKNEVLYALVTDLGLLQHAIAFYRVAQIMAQELDRKLLYQSLGQNMQQQLLLAESINKEFENVVKNQLKDSKN